MPKSKLKIQGEIVEPKGPRDKRKRQSSSNSRQNFINVLAGGLAELVGVDPDEEESDEEERD